MLWKPWQWGYESVHFVACCSFLHCRAGLDEAQTKQRCKSIRYTLAANFTPGVGLCRGIVEPFKHLLCATTHPQFLALELRAPMGACLGQYGIIIFYGQNFGFCILERSKGPRKHQPPVQRILSLKTPSWEYSNLYTHTNMNNTDTKLTVHLKDGTVLPWEYKCMTRMQNCSTDLLHVSLEFSMQLFAAVVAAPIQKLCPAKFWCGKLAACWASHMWCIRWPCMLQWNPAIPNLWNVDTSF